MTRLRRICRVIALPLAAVMFWTSVPFGAVRAGMVPTEDVIGTAQGEADRETVNGFLAREEVQEQIRALGVDPAEASRRVAALSNEELRMIAGRINATPAGGDDDGGEDLIFLLVLALFIVVAVIGGIVYLVGLAVDALIEGGNSEAPDSDEPSEKPDAPGS